MIAQRNSLGGKLPNYNIKKRQSNKSAKQREKIHFSHSSQIGWCTLEFYIWALAPESMASGCGHSQICSLVKWSVRLNDLSDFGLLTDEIDWEGGAAVAPSIRLMMAQASDGILRRRSRLKRSITNIGAPQPWPSNNGLESHTRFPILTPGYRSVLWMVRGPSLLMSSLVNGDWIWNSLSLVRIFTAGGSCPNALG